MGKLYRDEIEVGGELSLGAAGVNDMWSMVFYPKDAKIGTNDPATLATIDWLVNRVETNVLTFDGISDNQCLFFTRMPDDYDGRTLKFTLGWSAESGSGDIEWRISSGLIDEGETLDLDISSDTRVIVDTFQSDSIMHEVVGADVPKNAANGGKNLTILLKRNADAGADTHDADAHLLYLMVSYTAA